MKRLKTLILLFLIPYLPILANSPEHPRIFKSNLPNLRLRATKEPFHSWLNAYKKSIFSEDSLYNPSQKTDKSPSADDWSSLAQGYAGLYLLENNPEFATRCANIISRYVITDTLYFNKAQSRGLNRASMLLNITLCYDWCFPAWNEGFNRKLNKHLLWVATTVAAGMGKEANYNLASNWNGVRWGSVLTASLLLDQDSSCNPDYIQYDAKERIIDHLQAFFSPEGWPCEALGYLGYDTEFTFPALLYCKFTFPKFLKHYQARLPNFPKIADLLGISTVSIPGKRNHGFKPDFADDHPLANPSNSLGYLMGLLEDDNQKKAAFSAINYLFKPSDYIPSDKPWPVFATILAPENAELTSPKPLFWADSIYGTIFFRNRYRDSTDAVVAFQTSAQRCDGHSAPDNLGFRIIAEGVPWVTGSGRTGNTSGQPFLFPKNFDFNAKIPLTISTLTGYGKSNTGGWVKAKGSAVGVMNENRKMEVIFPESGQETVKIILTDSSENGYCWRMATPAFNKVQKQANGFLILAPNGSRMVGSLLKRNTTDNLKIKTGNFRYGGETTLKNFGIPYNRKTEENLTWIEVETGPTCTWELKVIKKQ